MKKSNAIIFLTAVILSLLFLTIMIMLKDNFKSENSYDKNMYAEVLHPTYSPVEVNESENKTDQVPVSGDYFMLEENGELVVYYSDKKRVFLHTGIRTDVLDPDERNKLKSGYYAENEEMLYALLESYSS